MTTQIPLDRRQFLSTSLQAGSALAVASLGAPSVWAGQETDSEGRRLIAQTASARMVEVGDGLFAVISTPLDQNQRIRHVDTLCNGGVIVTDDAVIAYDAYYTPKGAAWVNESIKAHTGRYVTHVIASHLHLDHTGGIAGFQRGAEGPEIIMTRLTWDLVLENYGKLRPVKDSPYGRFSGRLMAPTQIITNEDAALPFAIGGRKMTLQPMAGHTPSDLVLVMDDAPVTFAGDLAWWGLFPNYVHAVPAALGPSVAALLADSDRLIVTGHGDIKMARDMAPYQQLVESIGVQARAAFENGLSPSDGGKRFQLPDAVSGWASFNPRYPEVAYAAWYRDLKLVAG